ncbi:MAG TPA: nicotinate-nucleotide adenylyltransferase [Thermoanaerobaculia bacterium]|nr:nicotinate-nucleotide adenylyltransferase [Thermoanaerobaculia bacterium]
MTIVDMHIGVCGGTFDPFHRGHLEPVLHARGAMQWDRVLYVPAWKQPFKQERDSASIWHRFAMAVLATKDYDWIDVDDVELRRGGTSYTVDTLDELHRRHPGARFDWIIGEDNVAQLPQWREAERLFTMARFVVLKREGARCAPLPNVVYAETAIVPVSSTEIRQFVRDGKPIDAFVDPLVARYIHHYGLYKEGTA